MQETAINIGYACSLITDDMTQFQMQGACLETDKLEAEGRVSRTGAPLQHEAAVARSRIARQSPEHEQVLAGVVVGDSPS